MIGLAVRERRLDQSPLVDARARCPSKLVGQRSILLHQSVTVLHIDTRHVRESRLVKRGVFFVRKVMCMPLGSPPPTVDTTVSSTAGASERQRVETVTAQPPCADCHG